jgi:hypothetical protein
MHRVPLIGPTDAWRAAAGLQPPFLQPLPASLRANQFPDDPTAGAAVGGHRLCEGPPAGPWT